MFARVVLSYLLRDVCQYSRHQWFEETSIRSAAAFPTKLCKLENFSQGGTKSEKCLKSE